MLMIIGQTASHGFDQPLGLLTDCHRRVERFLGTMQTVAGTAQGHELPASDRDALGQAVRYEDKELFPVAAEVLPGPELERIGREMAARRDVPFRPPGFEGPSPA